MTVKIGKAEVEVKKRKKKNGFIYKFSGILIAFVLVLLITALIIALSGKNPLMAFSYMFQGAFSTEYNIGETIIKTCPLLLCSLGLCICYRAGLTSIGAEGQMAMGGLMATIAGVYFTSLPRAVLIPVCMIMGMIGGGVWAGIVGYLKAKWGISEIINTIMMNYIAAYIVTYMCSGPIQEPPYTFIQSSQLQSSAFLTKLIQGTRIHGGVILAFVSIFIVYFLLWKSPLGYQMRAVGLNQAAARTSGINVTKNLILSMALSGVFCGLAGAVEIMGLHHRLMPGFTSNLGFDAMAIALLGGLHPLGATVASLFFGALRAGASTMQHAMQVPASLVDIIQGLVVILVLTQHVFSDFVIRITSSKKRLARVEKEE